MAVNSKRVFYVRYLADQSFVTTLATRPETRLDKLELETPDETAAPVIEAAHAYQIGSSRDEILPKYFADVALLKRAPSLLIVSTNGAGFDTVNLKSCTEAGVLVVNQAGGNKEAVAEHVLGMLLALSKRIGEIDRRMRRAPAIQRQAYMGHDIVGKTIGIVGLGNIGSRITELCRGLFSMRVLAYDPYVSAETMRARGAEKVELDALLRQADFVSINCPLTDETRGLIGAKQYALMQKHAYFITTARGDIHDEAALAEALAAGQIAGAGLDVWHKEPPPTDHKLLGFDNVIVTAHNAGVTVEARANMGRIAAEQLLAAFDGKRPPRILNPEVWPRYAERFERAFGIRPAG